MKSLHIGPKARLLIAFLSGFNKKNPHTLTHTNGSKLNPSNKKQWHFPKHSSTNCNVQRPRKENMIQDSASEGVMFYDFNTVSPGDLLAL